MENMMDKNCCGGMGGGHSCAGGSCNCGMHMHGCGSGKHYFAGVLLKLILIALIFMFGFSLGQMTGFIKAEYGGYGGRMMDYGYGNGWGMMRGFGYQVQPGTTTPAPVK